jgi:hypothetical protein
LHKISCISAKQASLIALDLHDFCNQERESRIALKDVSIIKKLNAMFWFLLGFVLVILGGYIIITLLQVVFYIIGWVLQLIFSIFGIWRD